MEESIRELIENSYVEDNAVLNPTVAASSFTLYSELIPYAPNVEFSAPELQRFFIQNLTPKIGKLYRLGYAT